MMQARPPGTKDRESFAREGGGRGGTGFTLIELLVVLAIIGIAAAILLPVFASARERGHRTTCLSNERQLGAAMLQYVQDNDERFPGGGYWMGAIWASQTYRYVGDYRVYQCPDEVTDNGHIANGPHDFNMGYGLNSDLGSRTQIGPDGQWIAPAYGDGLAVLAAPARTVLFFEVDNARASECWPDWPFSFPMVVDGSPAGDGTDSATTNFMSSGYGHTRYATGAIGGRLPDPSARRSPLRGTRPRHRGGANYVACDGHAVWLPPDRVSGGGNAVASDCRQGTETSQPADCTAQTPDRAAGTADGQYVLTFSTR